MYVRNNVPTAGRTEERQSRYEELLSENAYLRQENKKLHSENEQLREVFRIARVEFEKKNREKAFLSAELEKSYAKIKALTEENVELKVRLETEEGKVKLLNKLAFGKRSEKLQQEESGSQKQHKRRGGVVGHKGRGRTIPKQLPVKEMADWGLAVSSGSLFGGLKKIYYLYLERLYLELVKSVQESRYIHIDESGWKLFALIGKKGNCNGFIWVYVCKDIRAVVYVIRPGRGASIPCETLFDMDIKEAGLLKSIPAIENKKRITVDRFSSYKTLERLGLVEITYCWAHQRRDFIATKTKYPELRKWADSWIGKIAELYQINKERIKHNSKTASFKKYDALLREKIAHLKCLINKPYPHLQQVAIAESMKTHWQGLTMFVDNPDLDMDNNISERMLRIPVLGRKNYWGNHALWAGQLSAAMFSIIQTCTYNDISPREYLTYFLSECVRKGAALSQDEITSFLPHNLTTDIRERLRMNKPEHLILPNV